MNVSDRFVFRSIVAAAAVMVSTGANAQIVFDWGGDTVSDSGKQTIKFNSPAKPGDIIVSFGDRRLYFITAPGIADSYPIAIPREQSRWEGITSVSQKRENPSWTPTPTMLAENPRLPRWVPGGHPMNPLGNRALYLGSSTYRIHGTDAPWTIGTAASKGCVRLFNKDVADLYPRVKLGTKVTVTWKTFGKGTAVATAPAGDDEKKSVKPQSTVSTALFSGGFGEEPVAETVAIQSFPPADEAKPQRHRKGDAHKASTGAAKSDAETVAPAAGSGKPEAAIAAEGEKKQKRTTATGGTEKPRRSAKLETGSVEAAKPASSAASAEDAAAIAARAEAAANRAAAAAERAAAAAERAIAGKDSSVQ